MQINQWFITKIKNGRTGNVKVGDTYNRLTALEFIGESDKKKSIWHWQCACGNKVYNEASAVRNGNTGSCGCLAKESKPTLTHGLRNSPEYNIWCHIKGRCYRETHARYIYYGGRGIKMCDEWKNSFEAFYRDMGKRPDDLTSIERIDTDGDYTPDNCKWADQNIQVNNRRNNRYILSVGKIYTLSQMADQLKTSPDRLDYLLRAGYDLEEIVYRIENNLSFKKGRPNRRILVDKSDIYIPYDKLKEMGYAIEE